VTSQVTCLSELLEVDCTQAFRWVVPELSPLLMVLWSAFKGLRILEMHLPSKKERNLIFRSNVDRRIMGNVDLLYDLMTEDRVRLPVLLTLDCVPLNRICAGGPSVSFLRVFGISSIHWFYFSSVPLIPFGLSIRSTTRCYITSTLDTVLQKNQRNKQRNLRWSPLSVSTHLCDKSHFLKP